jgi:hypothetical protein
VAFEAELALQCPDDRIDALPQPVREVPGLLLVLAGWADQGQASSLARVGGQADSAASEPYRWRMGHTWDAAQPSIDATSVAAGHGTQTNLSHGGL